MVDGSKGINRGGPSPGKLEGEPSSLPGKPGQSLLTGKKTSKMALLLLMPWQNLMKGVASRKTQPETVLPKTLNRPLEKEVQRDSLTAESIARNKDKGSERTLDQAGILKPAPQAEEPRAAFAVWIGGHLQNFFDEASGEYLAERIRRGGFTMGVVGLVWYDREKKRPGSLPLSLLIHLILTVVFVWFFTHAL